MPADWFKDVAYRKFLCIIHPTKAEPNQTYLMLGKCINYPDDVGTPTAIMLLVKILLNSASVTSPIFSLVTTAFCFSQVLW